MKIFPNHFYLLIVIYYLLFIIGKERNNTTIFQKNGIIYLKRMKNKFINLLKKRIFMKTKTLFVIFGLLTTTTIFADLTIEKFIFKGKTLMVKCNIDDISNIKDHVEIAAGSPYGCSIANRLFYSKPVENSNWSEKGKKTIFNLKKVSSQYKAESVMVKVINSGKKKGSTLIKLKLSDKMEKQSASFIRFDFKMGSKEFSKNVSLKKGKFKKQNKKL